MTSNNNTLPPANTDASTSTKRNHYVSPDTTTQHPDYTHMHKDTTTSGDDRTKTD